MLDALHRCVTLYSLCIDRYSLCDTVVWPDVEGIHPARYFPIISAWRSKLRIGTFGRPVLTS